MRRASALSPSSAACLTATSAFRSSRRLRSAAVSSVSFSAMAVSRAALSSGLRFCITRDTSTSLTFDTSQSPSRGLRGYRTRTSTDTQLRLHLLPVTKRSDRDGLGSVNGWDLVNGLKPSGNVEHEDGAWPLGIGRRLGGQSDS